MEKLFENKKVLFLGAHPDDIELGCGGTVNKAVEEGSEVYFAVFSRCEKSVPEGLPKNVLEGELYASVKTLSVARDKVFFFNFSVRDFPKNRQDILEELVKIAKNLNPDVVFAPSTGDSHQDHKTISDEAIRAFSGATILGYDSPWTSKYFNYSTFIRLSEENVSKKIEAMKCYASQAKRKYMNDDFLRGLARVRGVQSDTRYAEAFETIKLILI